MLANRSLVEERSKLLFGQAHRLALMIAIARSSDGRVNPSDLSLALKLPQSSFQMPLKNLVDARLLMRESAGRRNYYQRQPSKIWDWILELEGQLNDEETRIASVSTIRSS
ncbi:MAG: hypothetical protein NTX33_00025 [Propionibacteriales bacterium]|nr:hypothetical protein [Propionibacteriales bacterium]